MRTTPAGHVRNEAVRLREGLQLHEPREATYRAYWEFESVKVESRQRGRALRALELLQQTTGSESIVYEQARLRLLSNDRSPASGLHELASTLEAWAEAIEASVLDMPVRIFGARVEAATDLMEQVRTLLEDETVHPAAPIMLAGAALEELLRSMVEARGLELGGRPGLQTYAQTLATEGVLARQQVKGVIQLAGLRNNAAHGEFEALSRERAGLMEQQVNLLMSELTEPEAPESLITDASG